MLQDNAEIGRSGPTLLILVGMAGEYLIDTARSLVNAIGYEGGCLYTAHKVASHVEVVARIE